MLLFLLSKQIRSFLIVKEQINRRVKKISVIAKHKKWLIELQKTKDEQDLKFKDDEELKEKNKLKVKLYFCLLVKFIS